MKEKIAIIRSGGDVLAAKTTLQNMGHNDVIVVTPEEAKHMPLSEIKAIRYINPYASLPAINQGKEFVCKGRHQYRETNGKWVCQCGRSL